MIPEEERVKEEVDSEEGKFRFFFHNFLMRIY